MRRLLLAAAVGLALADAAIVTLALPELLVELDTTVEGVAAVIGVYTAVLALAPVPLARLAGPRTLGAAGFALFAAASLLCAAAGSLEVLLAGRALQGLGGAAGAVATFALLGGGRAWTAAAVLATAVGPALGGLLTEAFDWRAIFLVQAPVAVAAVAAALAAPPATLAPTSPGWRARPALGLALVSAATTAVLFLLVLLLVAGFAADPLAAAAAVTVTPLAALAGARVPGPAAPRAAAGAALVGGGTLALAVLPGDELAWTVLPQALAGAGLGLALTALAGPLLPERTLGDAARLLAVRHAGIALALAALAPVVAGDLEDATRRAQLRGVALVLDARLAPEQKLVLAPALLRAVDAERPRAGLREAIDRGPAGPEFAALAARADDTLVEAVGEAFRTAFLVAGALALLAAAVLLPRRGLLGVAAALAAGLACFGAYAVLRERLAPEPVVLRDPCRPRPLPETGGLGGIVQDQALRLLDATACQAGATREELVLALVDDDEARRFAERHGINPREAVGLLGRLLGG